MTQQHQQNHATWECKYHVVFIPKYRKKAIFGVIKKRMGDVFHELARRRESKIEEGHLMPDPDGTDGTGPHPRARLSSLERLVRTG